MFKRPFRLIAIGIGVICAALIAWNLVLPAIISKAMKSYTRPPVTVSASPVVRAAWTPQIDAVGTARAAQGADISVQIAGIVKAIKFKPNDTVKTGQLLVQIDDAVEQANIATARANIRLYQSQLERTLALKKTGYAAQATVDAAQNQLDLAKSDLQKQQATADLKAIKAPFDGVIGIARIDVGQFVSVGTPVTTVQDLKHIKVDFTVPEQSAAVLTTGLPVKLGSAPDALEFTGTVLGIDPKVDPSTRQANVQALVDNPDSRIAPGQFLRVVVQLPAQSDVLQLPQTAIVPSLYGDSVYVATNDAPPAAPGQTAPPSKPGSLYAKQVFVKTGRRVAGKVEIVSGLNPTDVVVWAGQNKLQPGVSLIIDNSIDPAKLASSGQGKYR